MILMSQITATSKTWFLACLLGATLTLGAPRPGVAAEPEIDLQQLIQEAFENSPEIAGAGRRVDAAKALVPQASTLPDPQVNFGFRDFARREVEYGVHQEFPFPGKLSLRGEVALKQAEQTEQDLEAVRRRVAAKLKAAYYELFLAYRSIAILEQNREILIDFEMSARSRYAVGRGAQQDVLRAQTEISRILTRIAIFEQQKESLQAEINRLLNRPPANPLGRPGSVRVQPIASSLDELGALVEGVSPTLKAQQKGIERGDKAVALAEREYFPDFALDVSGMRDLDMQTDGYRVMPSIKVPLYFTTRQREGLREALATRGAAEQDFQATRQELLFQIKDAYVRAQLATQLVKLLSDAVIPQASFTLEAAQAGYSVGAVDFLTLLNSLLTLQDNRLELEGETVEHAKAVARLEEIVGDLP
jgi:outer membrane protein TolC